MLQAYECLNFTFKIICSRGVDYFIVSRFLKLMAYFASWYHKSMTLSSVQSVFISIKYCMSLRVKWLVYLRRYRTGFGNITLCLLIYIFNTIDIQTHTELSHNAIIG